MKHLDNKLEPLNPIKPTDTVEEIVLKGYPDDGFIRKRELLKILPYSPATLSRKIKAGDFPRPVMLSTKVPAWPVRTVRNEITRLCNSAKV